MRRLAAVAFMVMLLAGCGSAATTGSSRPTQGTAAPSATALSVTPSSTPAATPAPTATTAASTPSPTPQTYVVQLGDSPGRIASLFGITVIALLRANPTIRFYLSQTGPDAAHTFAPGVRDIQVGDVVIIPATAAPTPAASSSPSPSVTTGCTPYTVQQADKDAVAATDTVGAISLRFGVTGAELRTANPDVKFSADQPGSGHLVAVGEIICIPDLPASRVTYTVQKGDGGEYSIAARFHTTGPALIAANPGVPKLKPGQGGCPKNVGTDFCWAIRLGMVLIIPPPNP